MNTLKFGNGEWYGKKDTILAYNDENSNYKPLPFDFSRASSATVINKDGLIKTVGSGEPRIDYKDDSNGALLLEPTRTNLVTYSEELDNAAWAKRSSGGGSVPIVTADVATSPDGTTNADRVVFDAAGGTSSDQSFIRQSVSVTSGVNYIISFYLKSNTASSQQILFVRDSAISAAITVTTSWTRFNLSFTATSTANTNWGLFLNGNTSASADLLVYGAQLEIGSYATSYIPTQGSAVTRLADSCVGAGNEQVLNDSEGTFFVNFAADFNIYNSGLTDRGISINDGTNTNSARIFQATSLNNRIAYDLDTSSGTNQVFNTSTAFADITDFNKVAFTYKENEFKIFLNGVQQGSTDTNGSVFSNGTLNGISFDYGQEGNKPFFGRVKEVKYFNTALTDQELQALTTI